MLIWRFGECRDKQGILEMLFFKRSLSKCSILSAFNEAWLVNAAGSFVLRRKPTGCLEVGKKNKKKNFDYWSYRLAGSSKLGKCLRWRDGVMAWCRVMKIVLTAMNHARTAHTHRPTDVQYTFWFLNTSWRLQEWKAASDMLIRQIVKTMNTASSWWRLKRKKKKTSWSLRSKFKHPMMWQAYLHLSNTIYLHAVYDYDRPIMA